MPRTVLIVEDRTKPGHDLAKLLEDRFDTIRTAGPAAEALEMANELRPDLVITPFPVVTASGEPLATVLKRDPRTADSRVLAYTDWCWANTRVKARQAGCDEVVARDAPVDELLDAVDRLLVRPPRVPNPPAGAWTGDQDRQHWPGASRPDRRTA